MSHLANNSSEEDSTDEEEVIRDFDAEARLIVEKDTLPKKSEDRYLLVYNSFMKWKAENKADSLSESVLIVYFKELQKTLKPSTLWSIWSMLKKTLSTKENVAIDKYLNLKSFLRNNHKGYTPKKSLTLSWDQIENFMNSAPDQLYLVAKVILIFGIGGALRSEEITNVKKQNVEDLGDKFLVYIDKNKNEYPRNFIIGPLYYTKVKEYMLLRPVEEFTDRFFVQYCKGKCTRQVIGRNKIGEIPQIIALYLNLDNAKNYTGHCFRRTSATLLSNSGASMTMIKQLGGWRSDNIAQGYIENSMLNREKIYEGIIHQNKSASTSHQIHPQVLNNIINPPSISNADKDNSNLPLNWNDFEDGFGVNNLNENVHHINKKIALESSVKPVTIVASTGNHSKVLVSTDNQNKRASTSHQIHPQVLNNIINPPSISNADKDNSNLTLNWNDFEDGFGVNNLNENVHHINRKIALESSVKPVTIVASTENHSKVLVSTNNQKISDTTNQKQHFSFKPPIRISFQQNNSTMENQEPSTSNHQETKTNICPHCLNHSNIKYDNCTITNNYYYKTLD